MNWFRRSNNTPTLAISTPQPAPIAFAITGEEYFALRELASRVEDAMSDTAGCPGPDALWTYYRVREALNAVMRIDLLKAVTR